MKHPSQLRLAMAQVNVVVGDVDGNLQKILDWMDRARDVDADIVTFPELALTGYPPEDLLLKPQFIDANLEALDKIVSRTRDITAIIGFVDRKDDIFNAAAIAQNGKLVTSYHKIYLPNYGVFDELRYFQPGSQCPVFQIGRATIGVSICEDIWYPDGPVVLQAWSGGSEISINIASSPYHAGKRRWREHMLATRAGDNTVIVAYNNLVGAQDELVFDGDSMVLDENGDLIARGKQFEEDLVVVDLDVEAVFRQRLHDPRRRQQKSSAPASEIFPISSRTRKPKSLPTVIQPEPLQEDAERYRALVAGPRTQAHKNGFNKVARGVSGGIGSD